VARRCNGAHMRGKSDRKGKGDILIRKEEATRSIVKIYANKIKHLKQNREISGGASARWGFKLELTASPPIAQPMPANNHTRLQLLEMEREGGRGQPELLADLAGRQRPCTGRSLGRCLPPSTMPSGGPFCIRASPLMSLAYPGQ
jgi:hypothetical protein